MTLRTLLSACLPFAFVVLQACGGGGGGGGGEPQTGVEPVANPSVTVPERSFTLTTHHDALREPRLAVGFSLADIPDDGIGVDVAYDDPAIAFVDVAETGSNTGEVQLRLVAGSTLAAGLHTATVRLGFCLDEPCTRHIAGSPVTVTVNYEVRPADRKVRVEVVAPDPVSGLLSDPSGPQGSIAVRVFNPPAEGLSLRLNGNPLAQATANVATPDGVRLSLQYVRPSTLGLGEHTATPFLEACFAAQCGIRGEVGVGRVTLGYTITAVPVVQQQETTVMVADYAWDAVRNWFVFLPAQGYGGPANRGVFDPVTGGVYLDPAGGPAMQHLALSPNGEWFVAANSFQLQRYRLRDLGPLGSAVAYLDPVDPTSQVVTVTGLQYAPDGTLAVLTTDRGPVSAERGQGTQLRLLDGLVPRPLTYAPVETTFENICGMTWLDEPAKLLVSAGADGLVPLTATASGLVAGEALPGNVLPGFPAPAYSCSVGLQHAAGYLFDDDGFVYRDTDGTVAGMLADDVPGVSRDVREVLVDEPLRRVLVLHRVSSDEAGDLRLSAYSLDTLQRLGTALIRDARAPSHMVRWGARGLAMRNNTGRMLLIQSSVIGGS